MRVTHSMMVNNSMYLTSKQAEKLDNAQTVVATGKQINKPSDDPMAAGQLLADRTMISEYGQYESNIRQAKTWIEADETTLDSVSTFLQEAQEILSSSSSEDASEGTEQLKSIYDQVLSLANSHYDSGYAYGGSTVPFTNTCDVASGSAADILFDMAEEASALTVEVTDNSGYVVRTLSVSGGTAGTNAIAWDGCDSNGNLLSDGQYSFSVSATDDQGDAVAVYPSYRGLAGGKMVITGEGSVSVLNNDGGKIFSAALSALSQAITVLTSGNTTTNDLSNIEDVLQTSIDGITAERVSLTNVNEQLDTKEMRLETLTVNLTSRISEVETGSTAEAAVKLQAQETAYEVVLKAVAEVLNMPKLSDYI